MEATTLKSKDYVKQAIRSWMEAEVLDVVAALRREPVIWLDEGRPLHSWFATNRGAVSVCLTDSGSSAQTNVVVWVDDELIADSSVMVSGHYVDDDGWTVETDSVRVPVLYRDADEPEPEPSAYAGVLSERGASLLPHEAGRDRSGTAWFHGLPSSTSWALPNGAVVVISADDTEAWCIDYISSDISMHATSPAAIVALLDYAREQ